VLDGQRPLLVEVQALVGKAGDYAPKRTAQGLDAGRLGLMLAVLDDCPGYQLGRSDVHAAVAGGVRVTEPGGDLAVALAIASACAKRPLPPDLVACGEVGLGGEIRQVAQTPRRLAEAARLGFTRAVVPESAPPAPDGIELLRVATLDQAIEATVGFAGSHGQLPGGGLRAVD
jgi:DNA repair protein RadA/Sms